MTSLSDIASGQMMGTYRDTSEPSPVNAEAIQLQEPENLQRAFAVLGLFAVCEHFIGHELGVNTSTYNAIITNCTLATSEGCTAISVTANNAAQPSQEGRRVEGKRKWCEGGISQHITAHNRLG